MGEFPFTNNLDQAGRLQLFNVMGEGRGAYTVNLMQFGAGRRVAACPDLLENLVSSWFSQGPGYTRKLPVRKAANLGGCHFLPRYARPESNVHYLAGCVQAAAGWDKMIIPPRKQRFSVYHSQGWYV
jgi:hypothetical protein